MIEIRNFLHAARERLGLEVAFVSQFVDTELRFRVVDAAGPASGISEGQSAPLDTSFCRMVVDGLLPGLIVDAGTHPVTSQLPATRTMPIGAHVSVPIRLSDGSVFGTFCCFSHAPRPELTDQDLAWLNAFAALAAERLERDILSERARSTKETRIRAVIDAGGPTPVYQPVFMLDDLRLAGTEALSRFPGGEATPVDRWFLDAAEVGLQVEFELLAIRNALRGYREVWKQRRIQLGLNASAATILDERLWQALEGYPRDLIVIELTEHEVVHDYPALLDATKRLRASGTKFAIDDVGAGYASMRHVLTLRPDILKLDIGLIRSIDADDLRVALTSSLKHFADRFACRVIAEGVETEEELATLRHLGLQAAQGYLLGRPAPVDALLARSARRRPRRSGNTAASAGLALQERRAV